VQAAPFAKTIRFQQPDGTEIQLWGEGDEFRAVFETLDGYTVTFDPARKTYFYATVSADGTKLLAADLEVGKGNPQALGLMKHVRIAPEAARLEARDRFERWDLGLEVTQRWESTKRQRRQYEAAAAGGPIVMSPPGFTTTGQKMGLCLLIDFNDDPATVPQASILDFCNGDGYSGYNNNGSVKQYFLDNSNNLLVYSNTVTAYVRMVKPKSYYNDTSKDSGAQAREMILDAIAILKAKPNYDTEILPTFSDLTVDGSGSIAACNVYYAGGNGGSWTYGLWPHSWALASPQELSSGGKKIYRYQVTNIGNTLELGTFCHENGHMLCGYPDIYDYEYDSRGGAGGFCLMNSGGHGHNPSQICAYLKYASGWGTTVEMSALMSVDAVCVATPGLEGFNRFYRYAKPSVATEYFLFENRQRSGRDAGIPASGIAIWHIDERGDRDDQSLAYNTEHNNYECTLVQADNQWHFQGDVNDGDVNDLYYSGNAAASYTGEFLDTSTPSARWWDGSESKLEAREFSASGETMTFSLKARPPAMLTTGALPPGRVGTYYAYTMGAAGGVPPYAWQLVSGSLPSGLALNADGFISGLPDVETTANFSLAVAGANGKATTNQFSLLIRPVFGAPFSETFESGGVLPDGWLQEFVTNSVSWSYRNGGEMGHPAAAHGGSYNACLAVTTPDIAVTRLVSPRIDFGPSPHAAQLTFWHYMEQFADDQDTLRIYYKTAADAPWTLLETYTTSINQWRQQTVTLPEPNATYYIAFEGTAKHGYGIYVDDIYVCDPTPPLGIATPALLPDAIINVAYTQALTAVGGNIPYAFELASGALPSGMTLSADGIISGTAPATGAAAFTVKVTDGDSTSATAAFTLSVTHPKTDLFNETFEHGGAFPEGWTQAYVTNSVSWRFLKGGGDASIDFNWPPNAHGGSHNAVLWSTTRTDNKTRLITPSIDLGSASATVRLTFWLCMTADRTNQDELRVYYKTSAAGAWSLLSTYSQSVPDWTLQSLTLPDPTSTYYLAFEGNARFGEGVCIDDVRITDEASAPFITLTGQLPNGFVNVPYVQALSATGGSTPYSWAVVWSALPAGLTLSSEGVISGTPVRTEEASFRVSVTGGDGYASTNLYSMQIRKLPGFPFSETFDTNSPPAGWTQEQIGGSHAAWQFRSGSPRGTPASAHGGLTNACLYFDEPDTYNITKLISPMLNLGTDTPNTRLSFWMCMASGTGGYLDQLRVYYRTNSTVSWVQIPNAIFTKEVTAWTNIVLDLPTSTPTYYIAFEGWANFGKGVCIDDVIVTGDFTPALSPYESWRDSTFAPEWVLSGDLDDYDGDGIVNALEYAMGLDPKVADTAGAPEGGVTAGYLTLTYRQSKAATDIGFEVVACTSLVENAWSTNGVSEMERADSNLWWSVTSRHEVPVTSAPQRFLRLKITLP
jgi:M6 family metalloprotease-like protein